MNWPHHGTLTLPCAYVRLPRKVLDARQNAWISLSLSFIFFTFKSFFSCGWMGTKIESHFRYRFGTYPFVGIKLHPSTVRRNMIISIEGRQRGAGRSSYINCRPSSGWKLSQMQEKMPFGLLKHEAFSFFPVISLLPCRNVCFYYFFPLFLLW